MMKNFLTLILAFGLLSVNAQQLAFPGAEGFGRFTTGGRGGQIYHVTNLNDTGAGSLRDAVSSSNRIVVFDVGGVINIDARLVISNNITIAGQTAPGGGITVYGNGVALTGSGNVIIRYIRFRMGKNGDSGKDAVGLSDTKVNVMFDHVSVSWGRDGTFDANGSGLDNITLQDCIISQGINNSNHSTGGLIQPAKISIIRSLWIDNKTRNPKIRGTHEFINNVLYNWRSDGYIAGDTEGLSEANMMGNYFIYGPESSSNSHITRTTPTFNIYEEDNWIDDNKNGSLDGFQMTDYKTATLQDDPYNYPGVNTLLTGEDAVKHVIKNVGASIVRDAVDEFLIDELVSYGTKGQIINTEDDNGIPNNVGTVANGTPETDTDGDGMPDYFEDLIGYDKNSADQNADADSDGYPNIEEYFNCLTCDCDVKMPNCSVLKTGNYKIKSYSSDLCLSNEEVDPKQIECGGTSDFGWSFNEVDQEIYTIKTVSGDRYLTFESAADGSEVALTSFEDKIKKFSISITDNLEYRISPEGSNLVIAVTTSSTGSDLVLKSGVTDGSDLFDLNSFTPLVDCAGEVDGEANIDDCGVCTGGTTGVEPCPGGINGEDFCSAIGVFESSNGGFLGEGYLNFDNVVEASATYKVYSSKAQDVELSFRYANGGGDSRPLKVEVNGNQQAASLAFPGTGAWTTWLDVTQTVTFFEGVNEIRLTATTADGGPNLDLMYYDIDGLYNIDCSGSYTLDCNGEPDGEAYLDDCGICVGGGTEKEECDPLSVVSDNKGLFVYPNPSNDAFFLESTAFKSASVFDLTGKKVVDLNTNDLDSGTFGSAFTPGIYLLKVNFNDGSVGSLRIIKQ